MPTIRYADEKEVTLPYLLELFQDAQYEASINNNGVFMVLAETALVSIDILVAENVRLIRFTSMYKIKDIASIEQKFAFANKLNNGVIMARFSILEADHEAMSVVYQLPFWGGIDAYHILAAFRLFTYIYAGVPSIMDSEHLIDYGTYPQLKEPHHFGHSLN